MSSRPVVRTGANGLADSSCKHHWLIDSPSGGLGCQARCKACGEEKFFAYDKLVVNDYNKFRKR